LATRSDRPCRWRLRRNELNELRLADLRFSAEETETFFQHAVAFPLPHEEIARLFERTEGWAAGLRLVALALQGKKEPADIQRYLETFTGSHRPILEYLIEDVVRLPSEPIRGILLRRASCRACLPRCAMPSPTGRTARRSWSRSSATTCS
jgi:LuxR family maltose regulon positive regulatory protein